MQSDLDARVARSIAERVDAIYTQKNLPRRESHLGRAIEEEATASAALTAAAADVTRLEQAIVDFQESEQDIAQHRIQLESLQPQLEEVTAREKQIDALRSTEREQGMQTQSAHQEHQALQTADIQIRTLRAEIQTRTDSLAPRVQKTEQLRASVRERQQQVEKAETALQQSVASARSLRLRHALAQATVTRFEKTAALGELEAKKERVLALRTQRADLENQAAALPRLKSVHLKKLQTLETTRSNAEAALQAMAAGIELTAADTPVTVAGQTLAVGAIRVLTEDAEIQIGSGVRIRIRPGGGDALATARAALHASRNELQAELDALGVASTSAAADALARLQQLTAEIETLKEKLKLLASDTLDSDLTNARAQRVAADADVEARLAAVSAPGSVSPQGAEDHPVPAEAQATLRTLGRELSDADEAQSECDSSRRALQTAASEAATSLEQHQNSLRSEQNQLVAGEARLKLLVEQHGEDAARGQRMTGLQVRRDQADAALAVTRQSIARLQPELVPIDRARLVRAIQTQGDARQKAQERRASAQALLQNDGSLDPRAALALAHARARAAAEHRGVVEKRAIALQTLNRLFLEEQAVLADRFTRPLAEKIRGYLECLFGVGVGVNLRLTDGQFDDFRISRDAHAGAGTGAAAAASASAGAIRFDTLSAGTREQVAAAVRLAMAEVLAQSYGGATRSGESASETANTGANATARGDGCLPLVFDDAFAYSDPERVKTLQRMLDLGAERGLQIIVLSCTPADYASFGAQPIALRRPAMIPAPRAPMPTPPPAAAGLPAPLEIPEISPTSTAVETVPAPPGSTLSSAATAAATSTPAQLERFLEALRAQGGKSGNVTLRASLGWDETTYDAVKYSLIATRQILPGRGRGGSVSIL